MYMFVHTGSYVPLGSLAHHAANLFQHIQGKYMKECGPNTNTHLVAIYLCLFLSGQGASLRAMLCRSMLHAWPDHHALTL